jgi:hypothetical protein
MVSSFQTAFQRIQLVGPPCGTDVDQCPLDTLARDRKKIDVLNHMQVTERLDLVFAQFALSNLI